MLLQVLLLVISIIALYYGAEFALESAEKIGRFFGLSPLVIGLLIVGFGTSLPEFFVSQLASARGQSPMALGNIVGSNVANLFLILGVSGVMTRLYITSDAIKSQLLVHIVLTLILTITLFQTGLLWWTALMLFAFFVFYLWNTFREMKRDRHLREDEESEKEAIELITIGLLVVGFALLYGGGELLVYSGTNLGELMGVSPYVISAVFVAFGTSFPELVTAILACVKKKNTDLITGNIIGSNIFNVSFVMMSLFPYSIKFDSTYKVELILLIFASLFLAGLSFMKRNFGKIPGALFLSGYIGAVYYWIAKAP
ncbi:MAG: calcium/sodium antiporter [Deltaproteobacteria bacterium]|nr:MAG: calcium/sodium antiporter [Deltaproteobacteria bacterium]